jgi:hypothetical protein
MGTDIAEQSVGSRKIPKVEGDDAAIRSCKPSISRTAELKNSLCDQSWAMVMRITLLRLPFAQYAFALAVEPLWLWCVLAGSVGAAAETVVTGLFKPWEQRQHRLARQNPEVEIEAQRGSRDEDRPCDCCQTHVKALPYHATLLSDQMLSAQKGNPPVALRQGVSGDKAFT